jgi:hypothetical protein
MSKTPGERLPQFIIDNAAAFRVLQETKAMMQQNQSIRPASKKMTENCETVEVFLNYLLLRETVAGVHFNNYLCRHYGNS